MIKMSKPIVMIFIMMLICCSCSLGLTPIVIGSKGVPQNGVASAIGKINEGARIVPANGIINGTAYLGGTRPGHNVKLFEFVCNSLSACGKYERGLADNSDGAIAYTGGVTSGATVPVAKP